MQSAEDCEKSVESTQPGMPVLLKNSHHLTQSTNMATAPSPLPPTQSTEKFEKENMLAAEYNAMKQKDLQYHKESNAHDKDIFWLLKHRMIHNLFDKIIKIEYGDEELEDEDGDDVTVHMEKRVHDKVAASRQGAAASESLHSHTVSRINCDQDKSSKESNELRVKPPTNEETSGPVSSNSASQSAKRSISDFLLKKLLFPYDTNLLERSRKNATSSKNVKEKEHKSKRLLEIHVTKENSGQTNIGAQTSHSTGYRHGNNTPGSVRKRSYQNPDLTSACTCAESNKKIKCYHELSEQAAFSASDNSADIRESVNDSGLIDQRHLSNPSQSKDDQVTTQHFPNSKQIKQAACIDLIQENPHKTTENNAQLDENSQCKQTSVLTKSDIVNLIIQRFYMEENQQCENSPEKDCELSESVKQGGDREESQSIPQQPQMQLSQKCDTKSQQEDEESEEVDNLLAKYKKYPIASKPKSSVLKSGNASREKFDKSCPVQVKVVSEVGRSESRRDADSSSQPSHQQPLNASEDKAIDLSKKASSEGKTTVSDESPDSSVFHLEELLPRPSSVLRTDMTNWYGSVATQARLLNSQTDHQLNSSHNSLQQHSNISPTYHELRTVVSADSASGSSVRPIELTRSSQHHT